MKIDVKYILMCEQAKEIQSRWRPWFNDCFWLGKHYQKIPEACRTMTINPVLFDIGNRIWLLAQDQLQDMVLEVFDYGSTCELNNKFQRYLIWLNEWEFTSMEQLWLAFVMWTKYEKAWDHKNNIWV